MATSLSGLKIDNTSPTIISVAPVISAPIFYHKDQDIYYQVTFSEPVFVTGTPTFTIAADSGAKTLNYVSGSMRIDTFSNAPTRTANGVYVDIVKATTVNFGFTNIGGVGTYDIDNVSLKELGWADRQELYDGLIAQGMSVADATRESAAWCYYNNDPNLGAVYGKIYNLYAAKLLQDDIDAYNIANVGNEWGWKVPTEANIVTLRDYLDPDSTDFGTLVFDDNQAGIGLKKEGTDYFDLSNTGTNATGFSLIGSGTRLADGTFIILKDRGYFSSYNPPTINLFRQFFVSAGNNKLLRVGSLPLAGSPIRLIKD
jgi:uncharacterized protein (TIGR02145 family)